MKFTRLVTFSPKAILTAIRELQIAIERLQPQKSSGTLQSSGSGGTVTKASLASKKAHTAQPPADDRPARWQ